jgi:histidinol-phosphate aminotransferase
LRFGFGIASKTLIKGLLKVKDSYNVDAIAISAATAAIEDQAYHNETVAKVKKERKALTEKLKQLGFEVPQSQTNFVFAKSVKMRAMDIYEKLKERNIYVRYWAYPDIKDKMRITVGTAEENEKLIKALEEILSRNE